PPLRGLRHPLRASHRSRGLPAETLTGRDGPVAPGDIAASAHVGDPLDPRLTKKTGGDEGNRHQVPHALMAEDGRFPVAPARAPIRRALGGAGRLLSPCDSTFCELMIVAVAITPSPAAGPAVVSSRSAPVTLPRWGGRGRCLTLDAGA